MRRVFAFATLLSAVAPVPGAGVSSASAQGKQAGTSLNVGLACP